jgi:Ca2+-binding RTX toxin-like protein
VSGTDKILLDDDIFARFSSAVATTVQTGQFIKAPGLSAARDGDDFLIYNTTTGDLYYDSDGNGAATAVKFAVLGGAPSIALTDFLIIN